MAHPIDHAKATARKHGGKPEDYLDIHNWFDATKEHYANFRHRALRHHAEGIFECERLFGVVIKNSEGKDVPTRIIGEEHVVQDLSRIPSIKDWLCCIQAEPWMHRDVQKLSEK